MATIIEPERRAAPATAGLSYWLSTKFLNVPLAMRPASARQLRSAIEARAFDGDAANLAVLGSKFVGSYDRRSAFRVTDDGIALVPVSGILLDRGEWLGDFGGFATTYEGLTEQVRRLAKDPAVSAVVLDIDSPGGMVSGLYDLTNELHELRKAKRVFALAANMADSAAYAIACVAHEVHVTRTGEVGSIGVVTIHQSYGRALDASGVDTTMIYSGDHKVDGNPFQQLSHGARAEMAATGDELYLQFVKHVAKARGLSEEAVRATQARTFLGRKAVDQGLADSVKSVDELLTHIRNGPAGRGKTKGARTVTEQTAPTASRPDFEAAITAAVTSIAASLKPQPPATPEAQVERPAGLSTPAAETTDQGARVFAILECAEAATRPQLARALAKEGLSLEAATRILAAAPAESDSEPAEQALGNALERRMAAKGNSGGIQPESPEAGKRKSLAEVCKDRHEARKAKSIR